MERKTAKRASEPSRVEYVLDDLMDGWMDGRRGEKGLGGWDKQTGVLFDAAAAGLLCWVYSYSFFLRRGWRVI
jgi:hypothetical protein